jgi:uncharacterized membrane protein AbrB (regulator of aidB expression)
VSVRANVRTAQAATQSLSGGLDLASAMLGASPGGLAEMSITAQTLHLSVGLVTAFHVVRALAVNGFSTHFWNLFERIRLFDRVSQIGRIFGKD